jgi:large subunit ribosomal protein L3
MGAARVTVKNLQVIRVDEENNLLYLKGAVPGHKDAYLAIRRAKKG